MVAALEEAYQHCRRVTKAQARNFYYAFVTLPPRQRRATYATYAFCRLCDDIADEPLPTEEKVQRLRQVEEGLVKAFHGSPEGPVFLALEDAAATFRIPEDYFHEVVRGVAMDLTISRYTSFEELRTYCYRVASVVGLICIEVFGYRDPSARRGAEDLGLAMQLTNILRDVREDAARGRIYLPQEELARFGVSEAQILQGQAGPALAGLVRFQVGRARDYFRSGKGLIPLLPRRSRPCPAILGGIYSRILDRIEARGYNVLGPRVSLSSAEKTMLMLRLWLQSMLPSARLATAW